MVVRFIKVVKSNILTVKPFYKIGILSLVLLLGFTFSLPAQVSKKAQKYFDEANYDIGLNQWESAKEKLEQAIKSSPNFVKAHLFLANTYYQLGEFENAIVEYEYTQQQASFPFKTHHYIAKCYFETGAFDNAIQSLDIYLANEKISNRWRSRTF